PDGTRHAARLADRIELVDEDDGGGPLARLGEQIAHPCRADPDEHLHELRAADAEERDVGFARDRPSQERLARPGPPHQKNALRDPGAEPLEALGSAQKLYDLGKLRLRLPAAGDVTEADGLSLVDIEARLVLAERKSRIDRTLLGLLAGKEADQDGAPND